MTTEPGAERPMYIYVSGPYSAPRGLAPEAARARVAENIDRANAIGLELLEKGHVPFVPHTMMRGWEDEHQVSREAALEVCHRWVDRCDALFFMGPSPGADSERKRAVERGVPIYRALEDVPKARADAPTTLSQEAREALLVEYRECMASYRHTYTTIWQAGGIFSAISAALLAFAAKVGSAGPGSFDNAGLLLVLAPIPFLFWCWGVFRPMNRYGEWKNDRLVEIERELGNATPGLAMRHFVRFSEERKGESVFARLVTFKWILKPRVRDIVYLVFIVTLLAECILAWRFFAG